MKLVGEPRAGTWMVLRVELLSGMADDFEAPPGRDFLVSPQHSFAQLADAINAAFARWDLAHLYAFDLENGLRVDHEHFDEAERLATRTKVGKRKLGELMRYEFDFGDSWVHRCTVIETGVDPDFPPDFKPRGPLAVWGWGSIPDQYGRTTPDDGGELD